MLSLKRIFGLTCSKRVGRFACSRPFWPARGGDCQGLQQSLTPPRNNGLLKLMQKKALRMCIEDEKAHDSNSEFSAKRPVEDSNSATNGNGSGEEEISEVGTELNEEMGSTSLLGKEDLRNPRPVAVKIKDVSYQHVVVEGGDGETHFYVDVFSEEFEGKSLVKRHTMIYSLLQDEF